MPTDAIVLAAGQSRRMGCQKLLLPYAGQTVIEHVVDQLLGAHPREVVVVTGRDTPEIARALANRRVRLARNPEDTSDMLASLRHGLRALAPAGDAFLVALGDQPGVTTELILHLLRAWVAAPRSICLPSHGDRLGHPVLVPAPYREELLTTHAGVGLRGLLSAHADRLTPVPVARLAWLEDIDDPADYRRALAALAETG